MNREAFKMEDETDLYYGDLNEQNSLTPSESVNKDDNTKEFESTDGASQNTTNMAAIIPIAMPFLHLYPIDNYTFGSKEAIMEVETSYHNRMAHLADSFKNEGMRKTVEAVMLTYENNHPHVLLFQLGDSAVFRL